MIKNNYCKITQKKNSTKIIIEIDIALGVNLLQVYLERCAKNKKVDCLFYEQYPEQEELMCTFADSLMRLTKTHIYKKQIQRFKKLHEKKSDELIAELMRIEQNDSRSVTRLKNNKKRILI